MKRKMILMRGIPGSGKSTMAKKLAMEHLDSGGSSVAICSTDSFHMEGSKYVFKPRLLGQYHELNQRKAEFFMRCETELVIIDNTNIKRQHLVPYANMALEFDYRVEEVIVGEDDLIPPLEDADYHKFIDYVTMCATRNTHGVPQAAIEKMAREFEK